MLTLFLVATFVQSFVIFLGPLKQKVFAEESERTKAAAWNAGIAFSNCLRRSGIGLYDSRSPGDISNGEIFQNVGALGTIIGSLPGGGNAGDYKVTPGYLVDDKDGQIRCVDGGDTKQLYSALGISNPGEWIDDLDIMNLDGSSTFKPGSGSDEDKAQRVKDWVEEKFGFQYTNDYMPESMQYIGLLTTFKKHCQGEENSNAVAVTIVDEATREVTSKKYTLLNGNRSYAVGYSMFGDGQNDQKMSCETIRDRLNATADAFIAAIGANPEVNTEAAAESNTTESISCAQAVNVTYGWIACPMLEFLEGTVDFFFNFADSLLTIQAQSLYENSELRAVWSYFRAIATTLLIVIGLVMVFSQILGGGS